MAAACAASAALVSDNAVDCARLASYAAGDAVMAAVRAFEDQSGTDFAAAYAVAGPRERAWQAERLASLESDLSPKTSRRVANRPRRTGARPGLDR